MLDLFVWNNRWSKWTKKSITKQIWSLVVQWIHVLLLLDTHLHKLWVSLIVCYKFQICLAWLTLKSQFYQNKSQHQNKSSLSQNKLQDVLICHKTNKNQVIRVMKMIEWNLIISRILRIITQATQRYETDGFSVSKLVGSFWCLIQISIQKNPYCWYVI